MNILYTNFVLNKNNRPGVEGTIREFQTFFRVGIGKFGMWELINRMIDVVLSKPLRISTLPNFSNVLHVMSNVQNFGRDSSERLREWSCVIFRPVAVRKCWKDLALPLPKCAQFCFFNMINVNAAMNSNGCCNVCERILHFSKTAFYKVLLMILHEANITTSAFFCYLFEVLVDFFWIFLFNKLYSDI